MSPRALAATLPKITRPILEKGGRDYAALIAEWPAIVGPALAAASLPEKLARRRTGADEAALGSVLTIRVTGGAAIEFQHREPQILERINAYLGHRAVVRLKLIQGPIPGRKGRHARPLRALTPSEAREVESAVARVGDAELRSRLGRLGRALAAGRAPRQITEK